MGQELLKYLDDGAKLCVKIKTLADRRNVLSSSETLDVFLHADSIQGLLEGAKAQVLDLQKARAIERTFTAGVVFLLLVVLFAWQLR